MPESELSSAADLKEELKRLVQAEVAKLTEKLIQDIDRRVDEARNGGRLGDGTGGKDAIESGSAPAPRDAPAPTDTNTGEGIEPASNSSARTTKLGNNKNTTTDRKRKIESDEASIGNATNLGDSHDKMFCDPPTTVPDEALRAESSNNHTKLLENRCVEKQEFDEVVGVGKAEEKVVSDTCEGVGKNYEDAKHQYEVAFKKSGGVEALKQYESFSNAFRGEVVRKTISEEIEKLLPQAMELRGYSKCLVNQPYVKSIDELYEKSKMAHARFQEVMKKLADDTSSEDVVPDPKGRHRAEEKAKFKYADEEGDGIAYYRLTDIVRGTLKFPSIAEMYEGLKVVKDCTYFEIVEFNDRFRSPIRNAGGYRDIQLTVNLAGFMCELQLSTHFILGVKETLGHRDYEVYRELLAAVEDRDLPRVNYVLEFCKEQLGSKYSKNKAFLPTRCHRLAHKAAKVGDTNILDRLIENGANVNGLDDKGNTPLHHAIIHGHERCVWLLLDKHQCKTDICNHAGNTALMEGYIKLYSQPSEQSRRAIATLLQKTDSEQVEETTKDFPAVIKKKLVNSTELVSSASDGDVDKMKELLKMYKDPNSKRNDGRTALQVALSCGQRSAVELLLGFGATIPPNTEEVHNFPCGVEGNFKWTGIALCGTKLFCAPRNASDILVIDGETEAVHTIPCGVEGDGKWFDIALCGTKLFCAPSNASSILVIDGETEEVHTIPCGVEGGGKWRGIALCGTKLFCAPHSASSILVIDGETEEVHTIPCGVEGTKKWSSIALCGTKLFCAPCNASSILVIDGETEEVHTIPCGVEGTKKWPGIALCGTKLFCAPYNASSILVIEGETEEVHTIPCGVEGRGKWAGIALCGTKLFCAPRYASGILVIEGETEAVHTIPCGVEGAGKWEGIALCGTKLFGAPSNASSILALRDVSYCLAQLEAEDRDAGMPMPRP